MTPDFSYLKKEYAKVEAASVSSAEYLDSVALLYHENSKLNMLSLRILGYNIGKFDNEYINRRASQPYKIYPGYKLVYLDGHFDQHLPEVSLDTIIGQRRSTRKFQEHSISLKELFMLLHFSYGISCKMKINNSEDVHWAYRNVPSAGALYPLELYLLILNAHIEKGLYHYRPDINALEFLSPVGFSGAAVKDFIMADPYIDINNASVILFVSSVFERMLSKYLERGYRFLMMEVGALGQNAGLVCEAMGLGTCYIGSFLDDETNSFLGIDGVSESVQSILVIGKKQA